jgi:hypothetical protein
VTRRWTSVLCALLTVLLVGAVAPSAGAATGQRLDLKVLLIGPSGDITTDAWSSELTREGVPFTQVASGDALPALADPADAAHGYYNGIILGTSASSLGDLDAIYDYERTFGVRQVDGYEFPNAAVGLTFVEVVPSPFTAQLTTAGKGVFNYLAGPVPVDGGSFVYNAYEAEPVNNNFVRYLTEPSGRTIGGFYTHTGQDKSVDKKAGVQELVLTFNYNDQMTQFRLLSRGIITWVTRGVHLGYQRNWLGNQVDDVLLSTSSWSTSLHCTPGETNPVDADCPLGTGGDPNAATTRMTAADVTAVAAWQKKNIKLDLAFNGSGASSSDPLTTALLSNKPSFGWVNHTWTHRYLGCQVYNPIAAPAQPTVSADSAAGSLNPATNYTYAVTALTSYGEATASPATTATLSDGSTANKVSWNAVPNATGYHVYGRTNSSALGLIATTTETSILDLGSTAAGAAAPTTNTAGSPTLGCNTWTPTSTIVDEISKNQVFAKTNKLPAFDQAALVTGEHSGLDNPDMPAALTQAGINVVAADSSREPQQYPVGPAVTSPRYPSNIYYNVSTWAQLVDEYNTIYLPSGQGGRCLGTSTTTCLDKPATKESILASETTIMLRHVLTNDPRLGYSHQSNLTGDRLILSLLGNVIAQYKSWFSNNSPILTPTLAQTAAELARQDAWRAAVQTGQVTASVTDGVVTVTSNSTVKVQVPITVRTGTTVYGSTTAFGTSYAGERSAWQSMTTGSQLKLQLA